MSNKIKKLICSLLAAAMVVSSASMLVFAEGEDAAVGDAPAATETAEGAEATAAPEAEATAAPEEEATAAPEAEATAAPEAEATAAPEAEATAAPTGSSYDNDVYYQKALALCKSLGVFSGSEAGDMMADSKITRSEMASVVLRLLNLSASNYKDIFTDVAGTHWAAGQIQAAYEAGLISGMGDGRFAPDDEVTYAAVIVMLVNALNYKDEAEMYGGWQQGYIKVAGDKGLLKSAASEADVPADRGLVIKMVYNTLLAEYKRPTSFEDGSIQYSTDETLAEDKFDVIEAKGLLIGTYKTSIGDTELDEGQIEIKMNKEDTSEVYDTLLTDLDDCVARMVTFYYRENSGRTPEVLAVTYDSSKSETYKIDSENIEDVEFDGTVLSVKEEKVNKRKVTTADAKYIYNGKLIDTSDITEDMFKPDKGSVTLVKSDKSAVEDYDVVFIDAYETVVISSASNTKITAKRQSTAEDAELGELETISINLDDSIDRTITITKDGDAIKPRNLKANDVATIRTSSPLTNSTDPEVVDVVVSTESITGSVSSMSKEWNETTATINGQDYDVANLAVGDLKTGSQGTFHLDQFGRIAYIESNGGSLLASGEKYGWIMNQYKAEGSSDQIVEIMTQDGPIEAKYASKVDFWGKDDPDASSLDRADVEAKVADMIENGFLKTSNGNEIRLVKFKANSSNAISKLYCAVDSTKENDTDALRVDPTDLKSRAVVSGLVGGYKIEDGILELSAPKTKDDMKDSGNYKFGEVASGSYVVRENGSSRNFVVGEFDGTVPSILITYTDSADALANLRDVDTVGNNPTMIVDTISTGVDEDDNPVYIISGYASGSETKVTTTHNTVLGEIAPDKSSHNLINSSGDRYFITNELWNAQEHPEPITDHLSEGDLILCNGGDKIIKLLDTDDIYKIVTDPENNPWNGKLFGGYGNFNARNMFQFGPVKSQPDTENGAVIEVDLQKYYMNGNTTERLSFDASATMDTVTINSKTGKATIASEPSEVFDVEPFNETTNTGDYIFARFADKGGLQEMVIYRFE